MVRQRDEHDRARGPGGARRARQCRSWADLTGGVRAVPYLGHGRWKHVDPRGRENTKATPGGRDHRRMPAVCADSENVHLAGCEVEQALIAPELVLDLRRARATCLRFKRIALPRNRVEA